MKKMFRIASISSGANSFGLHGHILVARDGTAYEVARNRGPSNPGWLKNEDVAIPTDEFGYPMWAQVGCEIPNRLADCPEPVLKELYGPDFKLAHPKSKPILDRARAGIKLALVHSDKVVAFVVSQEVFDTFCNERPEHFAVNLNGDAYAAALFNVPISVDISAKTDLAMLRRVEL